MGYKLCGKVQVVTLCCYTIVSEGILNSKIHLSEPGSKSLTAITTDISEGDTGEGLRQSCGFDISSNSHKHIYALRLQTTHDGRCTESQKIILAR